MNKLFVYGTLMNPAVQQEVLGRTVAMKPATLSGFKVEQGRWPYLLYAKNKTVLGSLLSDLSDKDMEHLDAYERITSIPEMKDEDRTIYSREKVSVYLETGKQEECCVYLPIMRKWRPDWLAKPKV